MSGWPALRTRRDWRGVLAPGTLRPLRAVAWGVVLTGVVIGAAVLAGEAARVLGPPRQGPNTLLVLAATAAAVLACYAVAVRLGERRPVRELAPRRLLPELTAGLVLGSVLFACVMGALVAGGGYRLEAGPAGPPWRGLAMGLGGGVIEELVFRGVVMRLLWEAFGLPAALALSASAFGLAHLLNPLHSLMGALAIVLEAGLLLGALFALTGRLWASIGTHAGWNFTQAYVFGAEVSGTDPGGHLFHAVARAGAPPWLTGGAFGPEASLPAALIGAAAGACVLAAVWRRGAAVAVAA